MDPENIEQQQEQQEPATEEQSLLDVIGEAVDSEDAEPADDAPAEGDGPAKGAELEQEQGHPVEPADPVEQQEPAADAAKPDDDLAVPDDLKGRTRERFEKLTGTLKTEREEKAKALEYAENWRKTIESTQAPPEAVGETLEILRLIHSGDTEQMGQALDKLEQARANLAKALGRELPGVDPLVDHPDLAEDVASGDITRKRALELAQARQRQQAQQARGQQAQQQTEVQQRAAEVDQVLEGLRQSDPAFAARMQVLKPLLKTIADNTPPDRWVSAVSEAYQRIQVQPAPAAPRTHQPLRTSAVGAGASPGKAPASVLDAINAALG